VDQDVLDINRSRDGNRRVQNALRRFRTIEQDEHTSECTGSIFPVDTCEKNRNAGRSHHGIGDVAGQRTPERPSSVAG
jgi:hypothetical protein